MPERPVPTWSAGYGTSLFKQDFGEPKHRLSDSCANGADGGPVSMAPG